MGEVVWWEVECADPDAFRRFHAALSGWTFTPAFADTALGADYWLVHPEAGARAVGGLQRAAPGAPVPAAGVRLYVEVDDLEAALRQAVSLGGEVERERTELGGDDRWFGVVRDPAGVSLGLWTANPPAG